MYEETLLRMNDGGKDEKEINMCMDTWKLSRNPQSPLRCQELTLHNCQYSRVFDHHLSSLIRYIVSRWIKISLSMFQYNYYLVLW